MECLPTDSPLPPIAETFKAFQAGRYRIGDILVAHGACPRAAVDAALARQARSRRKLGDLLIKAGSCSRAQVAAALSYQSMAADSAWALLGRLAWHPGLVESRQSDASGEFYVLGVPEYGVYVRCNPIDRRLIGLILEGTTYAALLDATWQAMGLLVTPDQVVGLINRFLDAGLIYDEATGATAPAPARSWRRFVQWRIPLADPTPLLTILAPLLKAIASTGFLVGLWVPIVLMAGVVTYWRWPGLTADFHWLAAQRNLSVLGLYYLAIAVSVAVHEFGHAAVCFALGGPVRRIGVMVYMGLPLGYCDVGAAYLLPRLRDRVAVSLGGLYYQWALGAIALLMWAWLPMPRWDRGFVLLLAMVSTVTVGLNLNPFAKLDGYYVFADLLGIPNLRTRSFAYLVSRIKGQATERLNPRQSSLFLAYGVVGAVSTGLLLVLAIKGWGNFFHRVMSYAVH